MSGTDIGLWVSLGFTIALCIWLCVSMFISMRKLCDKEIDKQIKLGNKVYCTYMVRDSRTKELLVWGNKYRNVNNLILTRAFYKGLRKIYVYEYNSNVNGVDCSITIYANAQGDEPCDIIEPAGEKLFDKEANIFPF